MARRLEKEFDIFLFEEGGHFVDIFLRFDFDADVVVADGIAIHSVFIFCGDEPDATVLLGSKSDNAFILKDVDKNVPAEKCHELPVKQEIAFRNIDLNVVEVGIHVFDLLRFGGDFRNFEPVIAARSLFFSELDEIIRQLRLSFKENRASFDIPAFAQKI